MTGFHAGSMHVRTCVEHGGMHTLVRACACLYDDVYAYAHVLSMTPALHTIRRIRSKSHTMRISASCLCKYEILMLRPRCSRCNFARHVYLRAAAFCVTQLDVVDAPSRGKCAYVLQPSARHSLMWKTFGCAAGFQV